jgi:rRNA-processing protein FCF1
MFSKITLMIGYAVIRELYRLKTNEKSVVRYDSIIIYPLGRRTKKEVILDMMSFVSMQKPSTKN